MNGQIIHYSRDQHGGILVIDYRKHRVLTFDSVFEQSKIDRRKPHLPVHEYNRAMLLPLAFGRPEQVTVLGLGGGVMVGALLHLLPGCRVHAVELRPEVAKVASEYFDLPDSPDLTVTIADAREVIRDLADASSDFILADMYDADSMCELQIQSSFVRECCRILSNNGWLSINYHRTPDINGPLFAQLRKKFTAILLFKSKTNNTVIFASKAPFNALHSKDPALSGLEQKLPIDWQRLMTRVIRLL